ncbi:biotin--[acetyl-CoA-carboxylase] ligase [Iningainema tapete]|uniref:Biotin--[acetyl-CoA-carboxylase] ligase n=1 Tax=Iningainema tapete BLCC-T55 TaxID=2748662 RepID=A0A8J6XT81_9CYAN|nr:biotin--[acetyl-CoA-carboxylase] ligase [Iningainema tapete BLCC-T55]
MELNQQKLETALQRNNTYLQFQLHLHKTVTSTNQILWDLLNTGAKPGCVVIAQQQTAGRGQWGRQWISSPGGLYLSVAVAPELEAINSYQLTLGSAWGIAEQLQNCGIPVGIKWPNDLVLEHRKLGGILTETKVTSGIITKAVIGVGINWANSVPETGINLQSLQQQHSKPISDLSMLAAQVLLGIESGIQCLCQEGANILISRYLNLLTNMGDIVYGSDFTGTVVGVTSKGELRVRTTSEIKSVITPEIYLQPGTISLGYRTPHKSQLHTTPENS